MYEHERGPSIFLSPEQRQKRQRRLGGGEPSEQKSDPRLISELFCAMLEYSFLDGTGLKRSRSGTGLLEPTRTDPIRICIGN